ncbi:MAG: orotate phosphoribosyltransferase [Candidatus Bathyarchaeota archaeon]|nr:orotate phosphoribosyltransferase [Candidatus Bathyarchaeum tardum]
MEKQQIKTELGKILTKVGALKFGTFTLTSGEISPYYMDLRIVPSFPEAFTRICDLYVELIKTQVGIDNFDRIAGIPTAGISFGAIAAYQLRKPFVYVRTEERKHGRGRKVEGLLSPGDRVLLIDDLVTKGGSIITAAESVRAESGVITDAVVLLDREENGTQNLADVGIKLHYMLTIRDLAQEMFNMATITEEQLNTVLKRTKSK